MANIIKEFINEIDFEKREVKTTTTGNSIFMTQGDVNAYMIKLIFAQSIAEIANVLLAFKKHDGTVVYDVAEKTSDTTAEYLIKPSLLDVDGQLTVLVSLISSDYKLTYEAKIAYTVNKSFGDGDEVVDDDRFPILNTLAAQVSTKLNEYDKKISNLVGGSPKGTYANLAALQSAYPTGAEGVFVVAADGHWYYWSGAAWTDGGPYQGAGIADGSIQMQHLSNEVKEEIAGFGAITEPNQPWEV